MQAWAQDPAAESSDPPPVAGPSGLSAGVDAGTAYDDNIFVTRNGEVDDVIATVRPWFSYRTGPDASRVTLRAQGEVGRYADNSSEDYEDWLVGADGRYVVSPGTTLLGGGDYQWQHEGRASPDAVNGLEPTRYQRGYAFAGALLRRGAVSSRLAATVTSYDFSDVTALSGTINNDDRDRTRTELGARIVYQARPGTELFVQGAYDHRAYDSTVDDFGFARDSSGGSVALGVRRVYAPGLTTEFFVGYMGQNYDDPRLGDVRALDLGAVIDWRGPGGLGANFRLDRNIDETTLPGAAAFVATSGSVSLTASPNPRVQSGLQLTGAHYDYRGDPRSEFVTSARLWSRYWIDRHTYVGLEQTFTQRSSNAAGFDYDENRLMLQLGAQLKPRAMDDSRPFAMAPTAPGGPYVGFLLGYGTLATGLDGPRGPGRNTADFGDHGAGFSVVAGYGWVAGPLYFGLEAEAGSGGPKWQHTADRVFSVEKKDSYAVALRLGYLTPVKDLIYGRFGTQNTNFETGYLHTTSDFSEQARRSGLGVGVGIEAAASDRAFIRAEYLVTSYDDYDVPAGGGEFDNFSTSEAQFRIGGGVRFGAPSTDSRDRRATDFSGPYVGVAAGHGALASDNQGVRSGGTLLDVTRSSHGSTLGGFVGYGIESGRLYAGVEVGVDVSGINWNIERDPSGRIYSAEHDKSAVISVRGGWKLSDSALVYGQVGAVRTRFDIDYATSGVTVNAQEMRTGLRLGGGLEIGLGERVRLRLAYSVTDYGDYELAYGSSADRFEHREGLASIGLAWRL